MYSYFTLLIPLFKVPNANNLILRTPSQPIFGERDHLTERVVMSRHFSNFGSEIDVPEVNLAILSCASTKSLMKSKLRTNEEFLFDFIFTHCQGSALCSMLQSTNLWVEWYLPNDNLALVGCRCQEALWNYTEIDNLCTTVSVKTLNLFHLHFQLKWRTF